MFTFFLSFWFSDLIALFHSHLLHFIFCLLHSTSFLLTTFSALIYLSSAQFTPCIASVKILAFFLSTYLHIRYWTHFNYFFYVSMTYLILFELFSCLNLIKLLAFIYCFAPIMSDGNSSSFLGIFIEYLNTFGDNLFYFDGLDFDNLQWFFAILRLMTKNDY